MEIEEGQFLETWDGGLSFFWFGSVPQRFVSTDSAQYAAEAKAMELIQKVDMEAAPTLAERESQQVARGVRVGWLKKFAMECDPSWRTCDVVYKVVKPRTQSSRARFVELPEMASNVGVAHVFASHTWGAYFADLVAAILHGMPEDAYVWLDIFAVRQWPGNLADLSFECIVRDTRALLLAATHVQELCDFSRTSGKVPPWKTEGPVGDSVRRNCAFFRVWCLVELASALRNKKPVIMLPGVCKTDGSTRRPELGFEPKSGMVDVLFDQVDVNDAVASVPADRARILKEIEETIGAESLNELVRAACSGAWVTVDQREVMFSVAGFDAPMRALGAQDLQYALAAAAGGGFPAQVKALLELGASPDSSSNGVSFSYGPSKFNSVSKAALIWAAQGGHLEAAQVLIDAGAQVNIRGSDARTPLMRAAYGGHAGMARLLITRKADINMGLAGIGYQPLHEAAINGRAEVVRVMLELGVDVNIKTNGSDNTALHWITQSCNPSDDANSPKTKTVEYLLQHPEARLHARAKDSNGNTPLDHAQGRKCTAIINLLLNVDVVA